MVEPHEEVSRYENMYVKSTFNHVHGCRLANDAEALPPRFPDWRHSALVENPPELSDFQDSSYGVQNLLVPENLRRLISTGQGLKSKVELKSLKIAAMQLCCWV